MEQWPVAMQILAYVVGFNLALTGIQKGLEVIQDKTATQLDNKAAAFLGKVVGVISKILDSIGYNPAHK